ncbi:MAG: hypothetical protein AB3N14_04605 [Flavobacteriaceae bacterium]
MTVAQCVNSGLCCRKAPCAFGEMNQERSHCIHLVITENETTLCGIYDEIKEQTGWEINPAFGFGCCMSLFNTYRDKIIKRDHDGVIPTIEIDTDIPFS